MLFQIGEDILELLSSMAPLGKTAVYGGYIRDLMLGRKPADVDIITNIGSDELQKIFPQARLRKSLNGHDVFSFKFERAEKNFIEIVSFDGDALSKAQSGEYTINSLVYYEGEIVDNVGGLSDFNNKLIRSADCARLREDFANKPYLFFKTLRLAASTGFVISEETMRVMHDNKNETSAVNPNLLEAEGYRALNGPHPENTLKALRDLGFCSFPANARADTYSLFGIPSPFGNHFRLCLLACIVGKEAVDCFCRVFKFPSLLVQRFEELYYHYQRSDPPSRLKNEISSLRKSVSEL